MLTPGARAKKFIRPRGSNAIFAAKRGLLAPAPIKESKIEPDQRTPSRFGKAFSGDYTKFFGAKRTTKAMRGAVKAIKDILVETYAAAMSLGATVRNIVKQLSGLGAGRAGGGGFLGKLGMVGLIAAVVAGVAAIFGPKIKEVFDSFKAGANQVFENVKGFLDGIEQKIISIYNFVRDLYNNKFKGLLQTYNNAVQAIADRTGIPLPKINLGAMKDIPAYTDQFPEGLNPLAGKTLDSVMGDVGNMLKGGLENTTGIIGDLFNNMLSGLGLTDTANAISETLGAGTLFGPNRDLGSGGGLSTFFPGLKPKPSAETTSGTSTSRTSGGGAYAPGRVPTAVAGDKEFQQGVTDLAKKYNLNEEDLYGVMSFESAGSFDPAKRNMQGSGATGLIQFMPDTARRLGTSTNELAGMSRTEQLKYVDKYFASGPTIQGGNLDDLYMSILFPAAVGKPDNYVLFGKGAMSGYRGVAYDQNAGLDTNGDGSITKKEAAASVRKHKAQMKFSAPAVQPAPNQNQSSVPNKPNQQQVSFLNNIGFTGANQIAAAPRRPSPIITGNGSGTEGSDYSFFPPGNSDLFDVFGSQLGIA